MVGYWISAVAENLRIEVSLMILSPQRNVKMEKIRTLDFESILSSHQKNRCQNDQESAADNFRIVVVD